MSVLVAGFLVGVTALCGIWLAGLDLQAMSKRRHQPEDLARFIRRRDETNLLLTIIGAIIGLGTLATGALRNAVLATHLNLKFPSTYILVFGLYYSGLLAVAYAPTYAALKAAANQLRHDIPPLPKPTDEDFAGAVAKRKAVNDLLQLDLTASATFKSAVAISTPLAGSLLSLLIGKK